MQKYKFVNFISFKDKGNFMGYAALELPTVSGNLAITITIKVKVMRNSHTGHVFFDLPSEEYTSKTGEKKYSHLVRIEQDKYAAFQQELSKAWKEYLDSRAPSAEPAPNQGYYPHGMAKQGFTPYKEQDLPLAPNKPEEEIPF